MRITRRALMGAAATLLPLPGLAQAQANWPSKPVRFIIPFAPGGPVEIPARFIAEHLQRRLGQPFIVETRPGAGGLLGTRAVMATPDAHNFLFTTSAITILPAVMRDPGYDPIADFMPVSIVLDAPMGVLVRPDSPIRDLADLVARAKARPGSISFATAGNGATTHMGGELFKARAGIDLLHVPYRGAGQSVTALYAGDTDLLIVGLLETMSHVREGRLRAIAVTSPQRSPVLPDVPSLAEAAPGYGVTIWYAMFAPKGTPQAVVDTLAAEMAPLAQGSSLAQRLEAAGAQLVLSGPGPLGERMRAEVPMWKAIAESANIRLD
ncbi:Bug family tripartite tricarboxylate transporter substrate binding protein [Falsiroseomonas stagni]|uniref:Tripartite-type tricarboxylate transporter, receptor component TctC n=1 Tax=Falsiroseomonas stagni DSM 19981 TaxID=1123062 RepID=A0A1I3X837_9PROT|nr:tripartite tricarboxylate transporter substrate-binding protein [Falsiroseomonas stagni]SFK15815.1 Tripartite-type tricarboxylate transporter, receptor component TctC [Falsiroseomonas stagni DSM 19981]